MDSYLINRPRRSAGDAIVHLRLPAGATVTLSRGGIARRGISYCPGGSWEDTFYFIHPTEFGLWTATATLSGETDTRSLTVSENREYYVPMDFDTFAKLKADILATDYLLYSDAAGDIIAYGTASARTIVRGGSDPAIVLAARRNTAAAAVLTCGDSFPATGGTLTAVGSGTASDGSAFTVWRTDGASGAAALNVTAGSTPFSITAANQLKAYVAYTQSASLGYPVLAGEDSAALEALDGLIIRLARLTRWA